VSRWEGWKRQYRRAHGGRNSRLLETAEVLGLLALVPLMLLAMPFVLLHLTWQERRRRCPVCGHRGTLEVLAREPEEGEDEWIFGRRRIDPETVRLHCTHCGSEFGRAELQALGVAV